MYVFHPEITEPVGNQLADTGSPGTILNSVEPEYPRRSRLKLTLVQPLDFDPDKWSLAVIWFIVYTCSLTPVSSENGPSMIHLDGSGESWGNNLTRNLKMVFNFHFSSIWPTLYRLT